MLKKYIQLFKQSMEEVDTKFIPAKYLNPNKNYNRILPPILKAKQAGFKTGLDFGCGSIGSPIVARLFDLELTGLDIPCGIDDSAEGERNRKGLEASEVWDKTSIHLAPQVNLQKMGYKIIIRDTTIYPWEEFQDNEFDFIMAYFALSKEWIKHKDVLDFLGEEYKRRLQELARITKKNGVWYVHPKTHIDATAQHKNILKDIRVEKWH